jgi:hypothetical protein
MEDILIVGSRDGWCMDKLAWPMSELEMREVGVERFR